MKRKVMAGSWLIRPLPLRERVGRGVAPVSLTLRTRRLVAPSPPHPSPLPRGSDFSGAIDWTARRNYLALFSQVCDIESSRLWRFDRYRLTHIRRWMERRERGT